MNYNKKKKIETFMISLNSYINEEKKTTGAGCVEMIKTILDQLKNEHSE